MEHAAGLPITVMLSDTAVGKAKLELGFIGAPPLHQRGPCVVECVVCASVAARARTQRADAHNSSDTALRVRHQILWWRRFM
jgi:hypothetical protein